MCCGSNVIIGFKKDYVLVDLQAETVKELFPTGRVRAALAPIGRSGVPVVPSVSTLLHPAVHAILVRSVVVRDIRSVAVGDMCWPWSLVCFSRDTVAEWNSFMHRHSRRASAARS